MLPVPAATAAATTKWSPHMKQMHPEMTDTQLEQMVQHCHGADREAVRGQGMMRRGMMHDQMMQNGHWY
ncbi:hypothetical protein L5D93_13600 [Paenibacillus thiaminolyticus]|nr:hypothetical protein [Paenibacillus thiaminolyticus]